MKIHKKSNTFISDTMCKRIKAQSYNFVFFVKERSFHWLNFIEPYNLRFWFCSKTRLRWKVAASRNFQQPGRIRLNVNDLKYIYMGAWFNGNASL